MKTCYVEKAFQASSRELIQTCDSVMAEYAADGFDLTLRQLYYYIISHCDYLIPDDRTFSKVEGKWVRDPDGSKNADPNYKWMGTIINDARLAGLLDWDVMVDRTREVRSVSHWSGPGDIVATCASQFRLDTRSNQRTYIEAWVEKEALAGIVVPTCSELDINCLVCRGFVSQSAMWQAAQRFADHQRQECILLHLGDHDPSGIDMTRDITDRLNATFGETVEVLRIALTLEQIKEFNPPPNPAKTTDSRYATYIEQYGEESWEMDALDPRSLRRIITEAVEAHTDAPRRSLLLRQQQEHRNQLRAIADRLADDPGWTPLED